MPHPLNEVPQTFRSRRLVRRTRRVGDVHPAGPPRPLGRGDRGTAAPVGGAAATATSWACSAPARTAVTTPGRWPAAPRETGDDEPGSDDGQGAEGGELPERLTPQAAGRIWASSMGLSFVVPASIGTLSVTAGWGRYSLADRMVDTSPNPVRVWGREPVKHHPIDIQVTRAGDQRRVLEGDDTHGIHLDVQVRERPARAAGEDLRVVEARPRQQAPREHRRPQGHPVAVPGGP
ncbi:hypothetical protein ACRAWF_38135 [Streptomyces sp. L7]